jgi:NAD-dependent dihydropyrimidine dehydrogenase PreA subunit/flavodoxin
MIFYFSATGNSRWVAQTLGEKLQEDIFSINEAFIKKNIPFEYTLSDSERIGFVFPVHSWGPPTLFLWFLKRLTLTNYKNQQVFSVCSCGDDAGRTRDIVKKYLAKKGLPLESCHTVQLPNTYILLPFFDVDKPEVEKEKLMKAHWQVAEIHKAILDRKEYNQLYIKGIMSGLKSSIIYPLFKKYTYGKSKFYSTDKCIHCRRCHKICPAGNILWENNLPTWQQQCVQCLACLHRCPTRAIEYGRISRKKGRYHYPDLEGDEL